GGGGGGGGRRGAGGGASGGEGSEAGSGSGAATPEACRGWAPRPREPRVWRCRLVGRDREGDPGLIAQLSDLHVGANRHRRELLRSAIREVNEARPDLVVVAGDLTDDGFPEQYAEVREEVDR